MTDREFKHEMESSINVKEQLPQLAEMLKDYPLYNDMDFYIKRSNHGFTIYIGTISYIDYEADFSYDFPNQWRFTPSESTCLMWYEAELLYVFQDCCWEMCEIVKNYNADKAA